MSEQTLTKTLLEVIKEAQEDDYEWAQLSTNKKLHFVTVEKLLNELENNPDISAQIKESRLVYEKLTGTVYLDGKPILYFHPLRVRVNSNE